MPESDEFGSEPLAPEDASDLVSPETTVELLGVIDSKLEVLRTTPNQGAYGEFTSVDKDDLPTWIRIRQIPIELSTGGVICGVSTGLIDLESPDITGHLNPANYYQFISGVNGVRLVQHGSYDAPQLSSEQTETLDKAIETIRKDRSEVWDQERQAGITAVHEVEAQELLELIQRAKLQKKYQPEVQASSGHNGANRVATILGRVFRKKY
jgi:hypothetical protein